MNRTKQEQLSTDLLRYGTYIEDVETEEANGYRRVRIIEYKEKRYLHKMFNGELIELKEI